jgi:predicted lipid-binding transport protein (Tim44 family)
MKHLLCLLIGWLRALSPTVTFAQSRDTLTTAEVPVSSSALTAPNSTTYIVQPDNDFAPALFGALLIGIVLVLSIIGAGIALTFLGVLLVAGFISFGLLSASILFGLYQRSFARGFQIFIVSICTVGGSAAGGAGLFFVSSFMNWWPPRTSLLSGSVGGLLAGFLLGLLVCYFLRRLSQYARMRLANR